ncbi:hypothetical protein B0H19DRAFT_1151320 [Mycena capillaripes]|nr:hypothetical protein B0H19DRAFT_1151320 [Mycena capillaripes]
MPSRPRSRLDFLDLPTELIVKILGYLPAADLWRCEDTNNRFLGDLIRDSAALQYGVEKQLACIEDTPYSLRSYSIVDRAKNLRLRLRAWLNFTCNHVRTITVDHTAVDLYDVASDIYFLGGVQVGITGMSDQIKYARIPALDVPQETDWEHIDIGRLVVDFAVAIEEHNLMAIVTYSPHQNNPNMSSVDIILLDFSTQKHHRLANQPIIHVHDVNSFLEEPLTTIEIAGDHLLFVIKYSEAIAADLNKLHIYNWKMGISRTAIFLAEDIILMPNGATNTLDVHQVQPAGQVAIIHSFDLPPLSPGYSIPSIFCKGSPHSVGSASNAKPWSRRRYTSNFEKSLIMVFFDVTLDENDDDAEFLFVFLRNSFIRILHKRQAAGHSSTSWRMWGPHLTRWLNRGKMGAGGLFNMSYGRRFVWIPHRAHETPQPIHILDFNPDTVTLAEENGEPTESTTATIRVVKMNEMTVIPYRAFQMPVISRLPYVETVSTQNFHYHCVAINEDNILGLRFTNAEDRQVQSIEVLQFGELLHPCTRLDNQWKVPGT